MGNTWWETAIWWLAGAMTGFMVGVFFVLLFVKG